MTRLIKRRKLYEQIAELIQDEIARGIIRPGEQLPSERDIMARYGVGRAAVREALFALAKMGLIVISSGERARVIEPSPQVLVQELSGAVRLFLGSDSGIRHMQEARQVLETALARRAAEVATEEDIAAIARAFEANRDAIDAKQFEETDVAFHRAIAKVGGNPIFPAISDAVGEWLIEQRRGTAQVPQAYRIAADWHARILAAIEARDPAAAAEAMSDHLVMVNRFYWQTRAAAQQQRQDERERLAALLDPTGETA
ncbi:MAG TPA: FCD domain-containing protein [Geminicoccaceae bacterium]|nr:FCD domain-containing protein [Geminicoccus sp.]HMU53099.1 FCD domain-containing protein [Geminicoccaceae bacterium]